MRQKIPRSITGLISGSAQAIGGLTLHGAGIGVVLNTSVAIGANRAALLVADAAYEAGKDEWTTREGVVDAIMEEAAEFVTIYRELLKPTLGKRHSETWDATGFRTDLQVPTDPNEMLPLIISMEGYLTAHAAFHNTDLGINPAAAQTIGQNLLNAINAVNAQETEVIRLKGERDAAARKLRLSLTGLVAEMKQLIPGLDARWVSLGFNRLVAEMKQLIPGLDARWVSLGFNRPGAKERPETPLNITATLFGNNSLSVKWDKAARAEYYRVWMKVSGVESEWVPMGSPADLDFVIESLPANTTVEIAVTALNNGGESAKSLVLTVQTS